MKKIVATLLIVITAGILPASAREIKIDPRAAKVFAKEFAGAENVKWSSLSGGYLKVSFTLNGVGAETFFDENAELIGTIRNLFYNQLPLAVMQTISNRFDAPIVIEMKEITNIRGVIYKVILEQGDKKYNLRLTSEGNISERRKEKIKR